MYILGIGTVYILCSVYLPLSAIEHPRNTKTILKFFNRLWCTYNSTIAMCNIATMYDIICKYIVQFG